MKVYVVTESDVQALLLALKEDPNIGIILVDEREREIHNKVQRFFTHRIHTWLDRIKGDR